MHHRHASESGPGGRQPEHADMAAYVGCAEIRDDDRIQAVRAREPLPYDVESERAAAPALDGFGERALGHAVGQAPAVRRRDRPPAPVDLSFERRRNRHQAGDAEIGAASDNLFHHCGTGNPRATVLRECLWTETNQAQPSDTNVRNCHLLDMLRNWFGEKVKS